MPGGPGAPVAHAAASSQQQQQMRPAELQMDPRSLPGAPYQLHQSQTHHTQVDVSTQVDLHDGASSLQRGLTPLYSREDIKEQYCITSRQLDAVEKSGGGIFGCLTSRGPSPCSSSAKASILSACVRSAPSDENLFDAPYPYPYPYHVGRTGSGRHQMQPLQIMYQQPYSTYPRLPPRYGGYVEDDEEDDWVESSIFRRRPKSFCTSFDHKRYTWLQEDEESTKMEKPRSVLPTSAQPLTPALHQQQQQQQQQQQPQITKPKHVSFARSHTLTSFDMPRTKSPPRPHNQERLIDSQPTVQTSMASALGMPHPYPQPEPRILVLEKQPKRGTMKAQATQTEIGPSLRGRPPVTLSPRTIHRVKMVSQGAQTNGILNGRKLTKSYSEAGQLGTPLGSGPALKEETTEHEPLQRTQSEEPPRSPFMVDTPPPRSPREELPNGDVALHELGKKKELELEDQEILIDFKPAPVSPDARALLNEMAQPYRRYVTLQKTLSDGEIQVERRELIGEAGEPSYPHTCRRNHQDPWSRKLRAPVQFSSTPEDLSLLRVTSPPDDHNDEEFHENLVRRGLFRKRSVSLEDGVQVLATSDYILPRSLPTSPTSPTSATVPSRIAGRSVHHHREAASGGGGTLIVQRQFLHAGCAVPSPFASSDSLTANDATRDHSDGIWNESQATVLQADSLALLTPSSKRRHLLILQHQQRSSMDTDALDAEDEMDVYPQPSPRIRLEAATPVTVSPSIDATTYTSTNGRPRIGFLRRSPGPSLSQPHSQSSSEFGLSRSGTTDISETSTTDDYITANTSTGTGTTTGTSATTSSLSRSPFLPTGPSAQPTSATATTADGSSFESASSIYSLARSEAVLEEPSSPHTFKDKSDSLYSVQQQPSPARSSSSSSSGSYDLEDAMPEPPQEAIRKTTTQPSTGEQDMDEGHHSSSGGYAESPPDPQAWTEEERRRRKKTFTLDFPAGLEPSSVETATTPAPTMADVSSAAVVEPSPSPSHRERHRSRAKSAATRSPHRNNKRRSLTGEQLIPSSSSQQQQQQQQVSRSPQKDEWREQEREDPGHVPTSDDSSCSHHYHMHHHHPHHHVHGERHRRTRESPRRKSSAHVSARRRSNEDKNAALTGSLPRRRSRAVEYVCSSSRLSPGGLSSGRHSQSPGHQSSGASSGLLVKSPSPEVRLKALSAESLRSVSPGSDSVFYSVAEDAPPLDQAHCHHCGREVPEEIVQPPAGFADSPEGGHRPSSSKHSSSGHRLFKKFDKRYRSEDRGDRRHHRSSVGRSDVRAKSEERGGKPSSRYGEDFSRKRLHARSTDASMEILTGREDEDAYVEPYTSGEWIYIGDFEESHVWKRPDSKDGDDELKCLKERRGSQESTESERSFRKKYQVATHRMVHRKSSGEMYKRIQTKCFESDKRVVVRREAGGEFGFRIHGSKPVVVSAIEPDTPAESSGLEVGDIVMSVNGKSVMEATHSEVVRLAHSGSDVLELEVARTCNVLAPKLARDGGPKEARPEPALCSGYLWRKSRTGPGQTQDKWVRRWFALRRDNCLYYYKTDTDSQPVGAVMLLKYDVELTHESRPHSFAVRKHGAPTLHLAADTDEAAARWTTVIREAVERNNKADTWLDASLKLQQLPACMIQRADCFGYLSKQHERVRRTSSPTGWSRRYCVLKDAALYFYDDANSERAFGVACLHGFRVHGSVPNSGGRKHAFELQPPDPTQRTYTFATDSEMEKKRWLAALEYSIDRWIKIG
ncbi:uncharacterized protein LOC100678108 isoform X1 [Nasonia vitripennis]|uniref:Uncharacterized protein n=1 Tax=Nasonia vitripennis TaxID=7425 RepID=A0A7M7QIX3_NASVI|nr:uncharacterized protein LOC100678108 isoform X1 [Nasonia vitripennis]